MIKQKTNKANNMIIDKKVFQSHKQLYRYSCIPMLIELVLKLLGRVPLNYFELQKSWQNKSSGSFADFNGNGLFGLIFEHKYALPRDAKFPLKDLFHTIKTELISGNFVIISLIVTGGFHTYIIYDQLPNGEFLAATKGQTEEFIDNVREIVKSMKGTDILIYRIA